MHSGLRIRSCLRSSLCVMFWTYDILEIGIFRLFDREANCWLSVLFSDPELASWCYCDRWAICDEQRYRQTDRRYDDANSRSYCLPHGVSGHQTQVNSPALTPARQSIYQPRRDGRLSLRRWLVTYRDGLPARRRSPIQVLTRQCTAGSRTRNPLITSPTP